MKPQRGVGNLLGAAQANDLGFQYGACHAGEVVRLLRTREPERWPDVRGQCETRLERDRMNIQAPVSAGDPANELLKTSRTIAVVGLSSRPHRPSYGVAQYLQSVGYRVIPVNPVETEVLGERSYPRLEDVPERVDIVDVFRRSEFVPDVVRSAIRIRARGVWMQEGVMHPEAAENARRAGLVVMMNACILKEHIKRFRLQ
jgi:uncharacterized protein